MRSALLSHYHNEKVTFNNPHIIQVIWFIVNIFDGI